MAVQPPRNDAAGDPLFGFDSETLRVPTRDSESLPIYLRNELAPNVAKDNSTADDMAGRISKSVCGLPPRSGALLSRFSCGLVSVSTTTTNSAGGGQSVRFR